MLTIDYFKEVLPNYNYELRTDMEVPVFWKRLNHRNPFDKLAFTLIVITIDLYTITIEGINEPLVSRALLAGAIEITSDEEYKALLDIIYDNTLDDLSSKEFEPIFQFFEQQLLVIENGTRKSDEYNKAIENIELLIASANDPIM